MIRSVVSLILAISGMCLGACNWFSHPEVTYTQIQQEIRRGDLTVAMAHADRAYEKYAHRDDKWAWNFRILKAQILVYRREYKEPLALLNETLPAKIAGTDVAVRKNMVEGIALRLAQSNDESEKKFTAARQLAESIHSTLLAEVLNNQGGLEFDEGKYSEAEATFRTALALARQQKSPTQEVTALGNLGRVATQEEHIDEAIDWNKAALDLSISLGYKDTVAAILGNMAWSYSELGDFRNALPLYTQAVKQSEDRKLFAYQAYWLTGLANSQFALRDFKAAEETLQQALGLAKQLDEKSAYTASLNELATVALETNRFDLAAKYNKDALEIERSGQDKSGILQSQLISARIQASNRQFSDAEKVFQQIIADKLAEKPLKWEAQARLAKMYDDQGRQSLAEREYIQAIGTIEAARNAINHDELRLTFLSSSIEFYEDYVDFLVAHRRSVDALKVAELSRARTLAEGLSSTAEVVQLTAVAIKPQQIAHWVGQTILFQWIGRSHSHLWVIRPSNTSYFELPKQSAIQPFLSAYQSAIRDLHDPRDKGGEAGRQLYSMLIEPAQKQIPQGSKLILLSDPALSGLNFETLIVPGPQPHFWIEDVTLTTASSLTLLASTVGHPASNNKSLLMVGSAVPVESFPALPQASEEMKRVESYFPEDQRRELKGSGATPSAYLNSSPERFAYIHFVTHGTASVTRPLESAVILSKDGDSYKLYARDIVKHPLNAQLVTISACEGAGRTAYSGEGLIGLSWAFLRAGAHNVIGALWEVNDSAAPELMDAFYSAMSHGQDTASALRTAKLSLLHSKDSQSVFRKPYYWAPFQLYAGS